MGSTNDEGFMREAIRLSEESVRSGKGGPFGCVIARAEQIVGRGSNQVTSSCDPTAHAEIVAIRDACRALKTFQLSDCALYASCEPCPMCLSAIYWARIPAVFFGNGREEAAAAGFDDALIYEEIPRPRTARRVTMHRLLAGEANQAFAEWKEKRDRVAY